MGPDPVRAGWPRLTAVVRRSALAAPLAALALAAAGCGGTTAPSVAKLATTAPAPGHGTTTAAAGPGSATPSRASFAACLTAHGFTAAVGSAATASNGTLSIEGVVVTGNVNPSSPQFQAALQACRKYLPGGGPPGLSPAERAAAAKAMLSFATCMRKNGVPGFPDPNGQGVFPIGSLQGLDPNSALFQTAFKTCEPLEPKVGPRIEFAAGGGSRTGS